MRRRKPARTRWTRVQSFLKRFRERSKAARVIRAAVLADGGRKPVPRGARSRPGPRNRPARSHGIPPKARRRREDTTRSDPDCAAPRPVRRGAAPTWLPLLPAQPRKARRTARKAGRRCRDPAAPMPRPQARSTARQARSSPGSDPRIARDVDACSNASPAAATEIAGGDRCRHYQQCRSRRELFMTTNAIAIRKSLRFERAAQRAPTVLPPPKTARDIQDIDMCRRHAPRCGGESVRSTR